jgi:hypothetical protein
MSLVMLAPWFFGYAMAITAQQFLVANCFMVPDAKQKI